MWLLRKENRLLPSKKKIKTKFINLDHAGNDKLLNWLFLSLGCWLMLVRRFCVYNVGLKVDAAREIMTVIMISNDENVCHLLHFGNHFAVSWSRDSLPWVLIVWTFYFTLSVCCVMYWTRINIGMFTDIGKNNIGERCGQVDSGRWVLANISAAFSQLSIASLTWPIKCLVVYIVLHGQKITEVRACFCIILSK